MESAFPCGRHRPFSIQNTYTHNRPQTYTGIRAGTNESLNEPPPCHEISRQGYVIESPVQRLLSQPTRFIGVFVGEQVIYIAIYYLLIE
jgi:hypothetical protein